MVLNQNKINEWQCSHCYKTYSFNQYINLAREGADGTIGSFCKCGKMFGRDKWTKQEVVDVGKGSFWGFLFPKLQISTVHLELCHFGYYYETIIFIRPKLFNLNMSCEYQKRFGSKEEALKEHKKLKFKLQKRDFDVRWKRGLTFEIYL